MLCLSWYRERFITPAQLISPCSENNATCKTLSYRFKSFALQVCTVYCRRIPIVVQLPKTYGYRIQAGLNSNPLIDWQVCRKSNKLPKYLGVLRIQSIYNACPLTRKFQLSGGIDQEQISALQLTFVKPGYVWSTLSPNLCDNLFLSSR